MRARYDLLLATDQTPVTALSRCAVALATLPVIAHRRPDAVVIWFDAHADINTPQTSTTDYLGGLALGGPLGLWDSGLGAGLQPGNVILAGTRDIDGPEQKLIDEGAITLIGPGIDFAERLRRAVAGRPVYVHIDCDVLEPGIVPTDYLVAEGLSLHDLHQAAEALALSDILGIEIGELEADPADGQDLAIPLLQALNPILEKADHPTASE